MKNFFLIFFFSMSFLSMVTAQKIGHLDSQSLLSEMPEVRGAESNLEAFQAQLTKKGEKMIADFQAKYQELAQKEQAGEIAPKALEEETRKLQEEEKTIQAYEQEMQQKVVERRNELLQPILDRVNAAIEEVSKELGYDYIIDLGSGTLLYADDQYNITEAVREKLGMI